MKLPFTPDQFLDVFRQYNTAVWPMQILLLTWFTKMMIKISSGENRSIAINCIKDFRI